MTLSAPFYSESERAHEKTGPRRNNGFLHCQLLVVACCVCSVHNHRTCRAHCGAGRDWPPDCRRSTLCAECRAVVRQSQLCHDKTATSDKTAHTGRIYAGDERMCVPKSIARPFWTATPKMSSLTALCFSYSNHCSRTCNGGCYAIRDIRSIGEQSGLTTGRLGSTGLQAMPSEGPHSWHSGAHLPPLSSPGRVTLSEDYWPGVAAGGWTLPPPPPAIA